MANNYKNVNMLDQTALLERAEKIAHIGHWSVDLVNHSIFWSKEIYAIHGVTPETFKPDLENAINFYIQKDRIMVHQKIQEVIENGKDFTFNASIKQPSGEIKTVRSSGECTINDQGEVTSIFGIFQDITQEVDTYQSLKESNDFLKLVMNNIPDMLFVKDKDFKIVKANEAFISAYPEQERDKIIGYTTVEKYNKNEAQEFLKQDKVALKDGFSETEELINFPNGKTVTLYTKKVRFNDIDQNPHVLGIARDITELKETQNALISVNEELEEFAYRTSHDLRSPLVSSISLLNIIKQYITEENREKAVTGIDAVRNSLIELETLVEDILNLTKVKKIEEENVVIDFKELITSALKKFEGIDNYKRVNIHTNIDLEKTLISKKNRLVLIIENLISNAIKYQDTEKKKPFLKISVLENKNHVELIVEDNGLGIPERNQKQLFSMFKRFHPKVSFGSGLGLYMLKKSVDIINSRIIFENTGQGSKFKVMIPYET
jgi:PAS domain S-box-containing protein